MLNELSITLNNETNTNELAIKIALKIDYGTLLYLSGDLGSGKTSFARGLIHALGFDGKVKSPSYSLVEQYSLNIHRVNHFDLYRFKAPEEWLESGFNEFIDGKDINMIEWPEKAYPYLPTPDLRMNWQYIDNNKRKVSITASTDRGNECIKELI